MYFTSLEGWKIQSTWTLLDYFEMHQLGDKNKLLERLARNSLVHNLDFMRIEHQLNKNERALEVGKNT